MDGREEENERKVLPADAKETLWSLPFKKERKNES